MNARAEHVGIQPSSHWAVLSKQWRVIDVPLRPCGDDVAVYESATVRGYFCEDGDCNDHHGGPALFPSLTDLGLSAGSGFGYEGSTGSQHGNSWLQCFNGLSDGFRRL